MSVSRISIRRLISVFVILLAFPLLAQDSTPPPAAPADQATDQQGKATGEDDARSPFEASLYTGVVVDSFAAEELNNYVNKDDASPVKTSFIAGVDFNYLIATGRRGSFWVFGETVHGVRSADVDCKANPDLEVCKGNVTDADVTSGQFLYILRNARSLEAFGGVRYERASKSRRGTRYYSKLQLGFITVAGSGKDVVDNHVLVPALGVMHVDGVYAGSYLEVGYGKTDLFRTNPESRIKVDGFLTRTLVDSHSIRLFLQMTVDSDFRSGSDSIQSYFGLDFDLTNFPLKFN